MIINAGRSWGPKTIDDLDNIKRKRRFIILSSINSETIPNIYDLIFSAFVQYGISNQSKTKVSVLNISETHGSIHSSRDRLRSVFFHTGICFEPIEKMDKDSIISFNHVDYNISSTDLHSEKVDIDDSIMTSYTNCVDPLMRKNTSSMYYDIIVPTPNFYEEYDMVKLTQDETNHFNTCQQLTEYCSEDNFNMFNENVYKISLGSLMDKYTTVLRIDYKIEYVTNDVVSGSVYPSSMEDWYYEITCNVKMILEIRGFCSADVIFSGSRGFNVKHIKSQLNLSQDEIRINYNLMLNDLEELTLQSEWNDTIDILIHIAYEKVHVKIIDTSYTSDRYNYMGNNTSDLTPDDMSIYLSDNIYNPVSLNSYKN